MNRSEIITYTNLAMTFFSFYYSHYIIRRNWKENHKEEIDLLKNYFTGVFKYNYFICSYCGFKQIKIDNPPFYPREYENQNFLYHLCFKHLLPYLKLKMSDGEVSEKLAERSNFAESIVQTEDFKQFCRVQRLLKC